MMPPEDGSVHKKRGFNLVELPKRWSAEEKASAKRFCMAFWRLMHSDSAIEAEKVADELVAAMEEWEQ